jgi:hypothetical protein
VNIKKNMKKSRKKILYRYNIYLYIQSAVTVLAVTSGGRTRWRGVARCVYIYIYTYIGEEEKRDEKPEKLFTCLTIIIEAPRTA